MFELTQLERVDCGTFSLVMKVLSSESSENTRRSFFCRMMEKALSRNDPGRYEIIHIVGQLRPIPSTTTTMGGSTGAVQTVPSPAASSGMICSPFYVLLCILYLIFHWYFQLPFKLQYKACMFTQ